MAKLEKIDETALLQTFFINYYPSITEEAQ